MRIAETKTIYRDQSENFGNKWKSKTDIEIMTIPENVSPVPEDISPRSIEQWSHDGKIISEYSLDTQS